MGACCAYFLDDCVATFCLDDPLVRVLSIFVPGHEYESAWVFAHVLILLDAEHHRLEAAGVSAFAKERHPIRGLEAMALRGALQAFVRSAESRLIRRELVGTSFLVEHEKRISAAERIHTSERTCCPGSPLLDGSAQLGVDRRSWGRPTEVMSSHEERVARNEQLFQVVNRHIEELEDKLGHRKSFSILCECSKKHCVDVFEVEPAVYQRVRSNPLLFFIVPGHEDLEVERVVEWTPDYLVVEKTGRAAGVVREKTR